MAQYIRFTNNDGSSFLVEMDETEVEGQGGIEKAGIKNVVGKVVVEALTAFEQATENVIQHNVKAFRQAVRKLPEEDQPETMELVFSIKATGEVGNVAIAKAAGEANYTVTLSWKRETKVN